MLPVVFEDFEMVYMFLLYSFLFTIIVNYSKNLGGRAKAPPRFLRTWVWSNMLYMLHVFSVIEFEKWRAIRASVGGVGGVGAVLTCVACYDYRYCCY